MAPRVFAAVDLGASGGRVAAGLVEDGQVRLETIHRFPNAMVRAGGHWRWPLGELYGQMLQGLRQLAELYPQVESIGIDTWGVDYGLLDPDGRLLAEPIAYRDERTAPPLIEAVHRQIPPAELYQLNGLQFLPFNTIYQLAAEGRDRLWPSAARLVLLADLLAYWLTERLGSESTVASTTGLMDVRTGQWSARILDALGVPASMLPALEAPGTSRGYCRAGMGSWTPSGPVEVIAVASHDTASAVVGLPARGRDFAFVSSGTWSLVGLEVDEPVLSEEARLANFTNEGGTDGRTRFLRNVGGLWLLQECLREWRVEDPAELLSQAESAPDAPLIDVDDPAFIPPGDMAGRVVAAMGMAGVPVPRPVLVRAILDSLATAYARTIGQACALTGRKVEVIHLVGGGAAHRLLCQLTAEATGLPVRAGPTEATALGNAVMQARARGALTGSLDDIRSMLAGCTAVEEYRP